MAEGMQTSSSSFLKSKWELVPLYLKTKGLVKQHIDSFDYFINQDIVNIVKANELVDSDIDAGFYLKYTNVYIGKPTITEAFIEHALTPQECRLRELTYGAPIYVDVEYVRGKQIVSRKGIVIGRMPLMLRSSHCVLRGKNDQELAQLGECPLDPGGYFVTRGTEKVILIQEQLSKNRVLVDVDKNGSFFSYVTSADHQRISKTLVVLKGACLMIRHNSLSEDVPFILVMKGLGIVSDKEAVDLIGLETELLNMLGPSIEQVAGMPAPGDHAGAEGGTWNQNLALEWLGTKVKSPRRLVGVGGMAVKRPLADEGREFLTDILLSHVQGSGLDLRRKILTLAWMARRLLLTQAGRTSLDDRDYVGNKRLELAGELVALLFEDLFKRFNSDLKRSVDKILAKANRAQEFDVLRQLSLQGNLITEGLVRAISTGNWSLKRFKMEKAGITQVLSRFSYIATLGMMMRINSQFEKTRKVSGPRSLQPSQWGMFCPADTPEGESCGLVKNLALMTDITREGDPKAIEDMVFMFGAEDIRLLTGQALYGPSSKENTPRKKLNTAMEDVGTTIFLNGVAIAWISALKVQSFIQDFRQARRRNLLKNPWCSIYFHSLLNAIFISSDGGRICRPLLIVDNTPKIVNELRLKQHHLDSLSSGEVTFDDLINMGLIEYLDVNESNDCLIAISEKDLISRQESGWKFTHMEIEPFTILGAVAGLIPFPDHNQSPRNTYQCAMGKQAMGLSASNLPLRMDSLTYNLVYPQKPLVDTKTIRLTGYDQLPAGQNAIVAVMSYSGYDIEDALVMNQASIDRGFGRCQVIKKFLVPLKRYPNGAVDRIVRPQVDDFNPRFECLDHDGIAAPGERLLSGYYYVNKQVPVKTTGPSINSTGAIEEYIARPIGHSKGPPVIVDKVLVSTNAEEHFFVKTTLRSTRRPEIGDKFSSRHGQKGVVGIIVPQENMPFTDSGLVPDIIMNPHGFPSRMTVGKMIELLSGKAGILEGAINDATPFQSSIRDVVTEMSDTLRAHGYSYCGKDYLTSGVTGEPLEAYIFFGPVYYQKLKHMVVDKMHARARGQRAELTRQPLEGRSKEGGLRLGEMERDCLIGYGASLLLVERLMISSDAFQVWVCQTCGLLGYEGWCNLCKSSAGLHLVRLPYAAKLLFQELLSMNIFPKIVLE